MKRILQSVFLPALVVIGLASLSSCKHDFSTDQPFPLTYTSSVYTANNNKMVYSLDNQTGEVKWKIHVDGEVHATPVIYKNALWVGTTSGTLYKIDYKKGEVLTTRSLGGPIEGTPIGRYDSLLVPAGSKLHFLDANTLEDGWSFNAGGVITASPTEHKIAGLTDTAYFISTTANKVIALGADGNQLWAFSPTGGQAFNSSPCVVNDSFLYIGNDNGKVYAVKTLNGSQKWAFTTNGMVKSSPIQVGGNVLVGSNDRYLYSIDSATGLLRWKVKTNDQVVSSPFVENQYVYFGSYDGTMYCVDIIDGHVKWERQSFGLIKASPTVTGGYIYIGSYDKNLYKLDTADGGESWVRNIQGQMQASAIVDTVGGAAVPSISGDYKY